MKMKGVYLIDNYLFRSSMFQQVTACKLYSSRTETLISKFHTLIDSRQLLPKSHRTAFKSSNDPSA